MLSHPCAVLRRVAHPCNGDRQGNHRLGEGYSGLNALTITKAHFAGLSMGSVTALGLAEKHPERLDKVIVCDAAGQSTPASAQRWEQRIAVAHKQGMEALVEPTIARWFPPDVVKASPPYLDRVRNMIHGGYWAYLGCTPCAGRACARRSRHLDLGFTSRVQVAAWVTAPRSDDHGR